MAIIAYFIEKHSKKKLNNVSQKYIALSNNFVEMIG